MDETEPNPNILDLQALEALQEDAQKLERIENLLDRFNIFEAIGFVGQEIKHSRFLAFLLDPKQNHGLGDLCLKRLLRKVFASADRTSLPAHFEDPNAVDLSQTQVHTERHNIDILLTNEAHKFAVIVENKVWTTEHSDQLSRYYRLVENYYPGWQVQGIYLTPYGATPSLKERYLPLSYRAVCEIVDGILEDRGSILNPDVRMAMEHYVQMVRRHIVDDPEVVNLARSLYHRHQRALDLIYKYRPDLRIATRDVLIPLIENTEGLIYKGKHKNDLLFFRPQEWDDVPVFNAGDAIYGFFRFVFHNQPDRLFLILQTSPGDEVVRRRLFEMGQKDESLFNNLVAPDTSEYPNLYRRTFLTPEFYKGASDSEREEEILRQWGEFLEKDLPRIEAALKKETWIWKPVETDPA